MSNGNEKITNRRHDLLYRCLLSRIYHQKRERFFDMCDGLTKVVALVGGAASIARIASTEQLSIFGAVITLSSALSLVVGYAKRARTHADLAKAFGDLEARIVAEGSLSNERINQCQAEMLRIEMGEPRTLGALVRICQNEIAAARGKHQDIRRVSLWQRLFAHLYDFDMAPKAGN
ncbi:hypothetical protein WL80_08755 [Burkholderia ubonensis]|uniref:hypothetical protein n=1 Tax=Burkholderia ubonensis TaxID=101571 RepID=UPI00076D022D|nr:hypothetical protein [Burkholderia ubonensis]KWE95260.1 hypothetical protein WL80_08755 [Burkholderia ubonensis]